MPRQNTRPKTASRSTISLCPNRIPYFGYESRADRNLAETIIALDRHLMQAPHRPRETSAEALTRLGFLRGTD